MRRLNLLRNAASEQIWQNHQRRSVRLAMNAIESEYSSGMIAEPLLPGSDLCNQIVVRASNAVGVAHVASVNVDSLDMVYKSLTWQASARRELFLDCSAVAMAKNHKRIVACVALICEANSNIDTIVTVDRNVFRVMQQECARSALNIRFQKPHWHSASWYLSMCRNAVHSVIVDSARALDAAFCGCASTLLVSDEFSNSLCTDALWTGLSQHVCCDVSRSSVETTTTIARVAENRVSALRRAVAVDCGNDNYGNDSVDWLDEMVNEDESEVVICAQPPGWRESVSKLDDRRVAMQRKFLKLREDPRGFCVDSKNPLLNGVGRMLPPSRAA